MVFQQFNLFPNMTVLRNLTEAPVTVLDLLRDIARSTDITMLCVTHEMNFARDISDQVLMFDAGRIVEAGPPEQIFGDPEQDRTREFLSAVR